MQINFKLIHPEVPGKVVDRTEQKVKRLSKLIDERSAESIASVEITKATGAQHSETAWSATINLDVRGNRFHAEATRDTPENAADHAVRELQSELRTHHAKERTLRRKGGGFWKALMQRP